MALEEDIISNEFGEKNNMIYDVEATTIKPRSKRLVPLLIGCGLLIALGVGAFFYEDLNGKVAQTQEKPIQPAIVAAAPPAELAPVLPGDTPEQPQPPETLPAPIEIATTSAAVPAQDALHPRFNASENPTAVVAVATPPANPPVPSSMAPAADATKDVDRIAKLEQKMNDLASVIEGISRKLETISAAKAADVAKPMHRQEERPRASGKEEVNRAMKDLKITALLTDGVIFEGDVAVQVGQYSKILKGKILSINPDTNTITTDNRIYKVQ